MKILLASSNPHKVEELKKILLGSPFSVVTAYDLNIDLPNVVEDKDTYEGNAEKKALEYSNITEYPCIADDSGLEVDVLKGAPGVLSARWSGGDSQANNQKLQSLLQNVPQNKRHAKFVCVIVMAFKGKIVISSRGECHGVITNEPRGKNGFGYDPLFEIPEYGKTFAELESEIKNKISHRAKALDNLKQQLEKINYEL